MIVFMLQNGWGREEIALCMNTVRFVLNTRILSNNVKGDLEQAAEIQSSLIPDAAPDFSGYDIAARTIPAEVVGGDFYDFIAQTDEILGVSLGDASGHGLPAALLVRDVVTGLPLANQVGHDHSDRWALHDPVAAEARAVVEPFDGWRFSTERFAVRRERHDSGCDRHRRAFVDPGEALLGGMNQRRHVNIIQTRSHGRHVEVNRQFFIQSQFLNCWEWDCRRNIALDQHRFLDLPLRRSSSRLQRGQRIPAAKIPT